METQKSNIVNKKDFLAHGSYAKEQYEGLLVGYDTERGYYNIGVQLGEDRVLVVDRAQASNIRERIQSWIPMVQDIQHEHGVKNDLENYSRS